MSKPAGEVERAVAAIRRMVGEDPAARGLALVGSRARGIDRPGSDVDFVLLTDDPARYRDDGWLETPAELRPFECGPPRGWGVLTERRLTLASGLEVDLGVVPPSWAAVNPVDPGTRRAVAEGFRVLHDPDRLLGDLAVACGVAARPWLPESLRIEAAGLELRDWTEEDAPALRTVCGDPEVCRFTNVPRSYAPAAARAWIRRLRRLRSAGEGIALAIGAARRPGPLGTVNLGRFSADCREAALGYWVLPAARRRGLATAASAALTGWGFERLGLDRIELAILPDNVASLRVAERLGARAEGIRRASHTAEGRAWDMAIYSLSAAERRSPCIEGTNEMPTITPSGACRRATV